jgi:hypothetical protein
VVGFAGPGDRKRGRTCRLLGCVFSGHKYLQWSYRQLAVGAVADRGRNARGAANNAAGRRKKSARDDRSTVERPLVYRTLVSWPYGI